MLKEQSKDKEEVIITQLLYDIWDSESEIVTTDEDSFLCSINNNPDSLPKHFVIYQKGKHRFCLRSKDAQRYLGGKIGYRTITDKLDQFGLLDVKKDRTTAVFKGKSMEDIASNAENGIYHVPLPASREFLSFLNPIL